MNRRRHKLIKLAAAIAVLAAPIAVATAAVGGSDGQTADSWVPPASTAPDAPKGQRVLATNDGRALYMMEYEDQICLTITDHAGAAGEDGGAAGEACFTSVAVNSGAALPSYWYSGCNGEEGQQPVCSRLSLYGVVPDGVESVSARLPDGRSIDTRVTSGAYLLDIAGATDPVAITLNRADGSAQRSIELSEPAQ
jgi:hypothetical protein